MRHEVHNEEMFRIKREAVYDYIMVHKWPYWISALTVGLVAIGYARSVNLAESLAHHLYSHSSEYLFVLSPALFVASWAIVYFFAPEAKGSGIPQVMAAVEMMEKDENAPSASKLLGIRIAIVKMISSLLVLVGGGAIGREGPTLQISASIFYFASNRFKLFKKYINNEIWIMTGAAAGLAAAFNTPLGGLVYAIEELASQHLNKFKTSLIAAVIIAGFSSQFISGPYLYLGYPPIKSINATVFPLVILISVACGILGALFGRILFELSRWKLQRFNSVKAMLSIAIFCGLATAAVAVFIDPRFMGSGKELLLHMLFTEEALDWHVPFLRFFAPILTYLAGGAGGIFAPSLAAGGSIGHLVADYTISTHSNLFTLLGMIAFLTGVTRAPFTAFILVLEMTDRHSAIFPMMLSAILANNSAKFFGQRSFYELLKQSYLPEVPKASDSDLTQKS